MAHSAEEPLPLAAGEHPPVPGAVKISSIDMATRHHSARTKARKAALDILFEADLLQRDPFESLADRLDDPDQLVREFTRELVLGVRDNADQIDRRISALTPRQWPIERMPRVDRNLARMAVYELDHTGIEASAAISEAVGLADELSTDDSVAFLNGLLARAAQTRPGRTTNEQP
ncbi:MAG: transcription antitermination factor NusB [Brooklawnia sp.]|uniref:transcription antitermination factor NusB n=1 Tax=Brooklawnia sp. TaxID=2699740 RepID=UPI003C760459